MIPDNAKEICYRGAIIYYIGDMDTTNEVWSKDLITQGITQVYSSINHAKETIDHILSRREQDTYNQCDSTIQLGETPWILIGAAIIAAYLIMRK